MPMKKIDSSSSEPSGHSQAFSPASTNALMEDDLLTSTDNERSRSPLINVTSPRQPANTQRIDQPSPFSVLCEYASRVLLESGEFPQDDEENRDEEEQKEKKDADGNQKGQ